MILVNLLLDKYQILQIQICNTGCRLWKSGKCSVPGSIKIYKVDNHYENFMGSMKSSEQIHNEMKTQAYILRIFKIKVCGFSINVKVKFHSNLQKQNFYKKFYTQ